VTTTPLLPPRRKGLVIHERKIVRLKFICWPRVVSEAGKSSRQGKDRRIEGSILLSYPGKARIEGAKDEDERKGAKFSTGSETRPCI